MMTRSAFAARRNAYFDRLATLGAHDASLAFSRHTDREATAVVRARMSDGYVVLQEVSALTELTHDDFARAEAILAAEGL
jgi:hypothetical protein